MDNEQAGPPRLSRTIVVVIGLLAVLAALAVGHLVAGLINPNASPFVAVGNSVRDLTPPDVTEWAIRNLGDWKGPLLLGGIAVLLVVFAAVAGLLSRRRVWPGAALAAVVGLVALAAVRYQSTVAPIGVLAPIASLVAGVAVFVVLHRLARKRAAARPEPVAGSGNSRRTFLWTSAGVAAGTAVIGGGGQLLASRRDAAGSRAGIGALSAADPAPPIPRGADFAEDGTPTFLTRNSDFYRVDTALVSVPQVRAEDWRLSVHGMVDRPRTYSYSDLRDRPLVERTITMTCVSNEVGGHYVSTANFIGVPLADLLDEAGVRDRADQLYSTSVDGWTAGTPVDAVMDRQRGALLAIGMNGEPLPIEHGFPARMVVPGLYGFVSATKWVVDMELTTFDAKRSYWLDRGWGQRAPIKTQSRIDWPAGFAELSAGRVAVVGVAWAQHIGIQKVEVRIGTGPWQEARLATEVNVQTWRMWRAEFDLEPGRYQAEVRATDRTGRTQPNTGMKPIPDGATGWHSTVFTVR